MKNIDFLPQRYREHDAAHVARWWRLLVVWIFGAAICASALYQYRLYAAAQSELAQVDACYEEVLGLQSRLQRAEEARAAQDREADLFAYLRHPWPRTQIIAALASPLHASLTFRELRLSRETGTAAAAPSQFGSSADPENVSGTPSPNANSQHDLARLRETYDRARLIAEVEGSAADLAALHAYVAALRKNRLFDRVELVSLENEGKTAEVAAQFRLRLVVKFGYGQLAGPSVALEIPTTPPQEG